ncbi:expressed unknown protein [Seminavis robusta]|uniref:Uncharacterized protein n=1 Tax=Seminavis robusta TaxID=568900 RepID=A0A9N8D6R7_9STRA|nr:expressed unknown protein [Seminavis robusta]|eukprot:Sro19_g013570.1 n/a (415) ;mRNA; f:118740-119984
MTTKEEGETEAPEKTLPSLSQVEEGIVSPQREENSRQSSNVQEEVAPTYLWQNHENNGQGQKSSPPAPARLPRNLPRKQPIVQASKVANQQGDSSCSNNKEDNRKLNTGPNNQQEEEAPSYWWQNHENGEWWSGKIKVPQSQAMNDRGNDDGNNDQLKENTSTIKIIPGDEENEAYQRVSGGGSNTRLLVGDKNSTLWIGTNGDVQGAVPPQTQTMQDRADYDCEKHEEPKLDEPKRRSMNDACPWMQDCPGGAYCPCMVVCLPCMVVYLQCYCCRDCLLYICDTSNSKHDRPIFEGPEGGMRTCNDQKRDMQEVSFDCCDRVWCGNDDSPGLCPEVCDQGICDNGIQHFCGDCSKMCSDGCQCCGDCCMDCLCCDGCNCGGCDCDCGGDCGDAGECLFCILCCPCQVLAGASN